MNRQERLDALIGLGIWGLWLATCLAFGLLLMAWWL